MATVAGALAEAGQHEQAVTVTAEAETVARSITDPDQRAQTLAAVAEALAEAGEHEEAASMARSIIDPDLRARAPVAEALAEAGEHEEAATAARSITDPDGRAGAGGGGRGAGGEGGHETGASPGFGGMCRRALDDGAGTGVVARAVGGQSARRPVIRGREGCDESHDAFSE